MKRRQLKKQYEKPKILGYKDGKLTELLAPHGLNGK